MPTLALPQVTLCAVDARCPQMALESLHLSMRQVRFGRVVLFTHDCAIDDPTVEVVDVGPIRSGSEYSRFVLSCLPKHIHSRHVLITQWDGFVLNPDAWRGDFLDYDYIGAPWDDQPSRMSVGNGGFSLRSQRVLRAGCDARILEPHPEDVALCRTYRGLLEREFGVRFAPPEMAAAFAYENGTPMGPTFGFHGPKNLPSVLDHDTMRRWIRQLPDDFFRGRDARRLMRALLRNRSADLAADVAAHRLRVGRREPMTRLTAWLAPALHSALRAAGFGR